VKAAGEAVEVKSWPELIQIRFEKHPQHLDKKSRLRKKIKAAVKNGRKKFYCHFLWRGYAGDRRNIL
jgi:hypothetical protein